MVLDYSAGRRAARMARQTRSGVAGMSIWSMPSGAQRIDDRVHDRLRRGDAAGLARALDAERIGRRRQLDEGDVEGRQVVGARQRVIHQRAAQQLARVRVVDGVLEQRLADALGQRRPAPGPSVSIGLISAAVIVDRGIAREASTAPVSGSISTSATWQPLGKVKTSDMFIDMLSRPGAMPCRQVGRVGRRAGNRDQVDLAPDRLDREPALGKHDIGGSACSRCGGDARGPCRSPGRSP